jgi:hypothetical protein
MERIDQLIVDYFDGELSYREERELAQSLEQDAALRRDFLELYREHRLLRAELEAAPETDLSPAVLAALRNDQSDFVQAVMRNVEAMHGPVGICRANAGQKLRVPRQTFGERLASAWLVLFSPPARLVMAAALALLACVTLYVTVKPEPVRAWVRKTEREVMVERGRRSIPVASGFILRAGDVVRTGADGSVTVTYFGESTEVQARGDAVLRLTSARRGKRLELDRGLLEASVARQSPGRPMILATRQAQVRVLGTRFILEAKTASTWLTVLEGSIELTRLSDVQSVRVGSGEWAVAARGVELLKRPLEGDLVPGSPVPVRIALFSEYPEDEDWFTSPTTVQQRHPLGLSTQLFKVPPVEGRVLLEVVVRVDSVAPGTWLAAAGWGFGLGIRCQGEQEPIELHTFQRVSDGVLALADQRTTRLDAVPLRHPAAGEYQLKVELDRPLVGPAVVRGKLWRQFQPEPAEWMVIAPHECRGPVAAVALSTLNCACTFARLKLSLIE